MRVWDVPVRLTFILTWRNALLLFRICNLCYYGRVVHGNEMLCTFGYRFFLFFFSLSPPPVIPPRTLPQHATVPRLCTGSSVRGAQRSNPGFLSQACTSIPLELTHAHARREKKKKPKTKHEMSARRRGGHCAPTCGVTVRRAGDKQSVGPAVEWCVSGRHSTAAARSAPARLGSALSSLSCSCVLQCLPRDGDRPPPAGPCKSWATQQQQHGSNTPIILGGSVRPPRSLAPFSPVYRCLPLFTPVYRSLPPLTPRLARAVWSELPI